MLSILRNRSSKGAFAQFCPPFKDDFSNTQFGAFIDIKNDLDLIIPFFFGLNIDFSVQKTFFQKKVLNSSSDPLYLKRTVIRIGKNIFTIFLELFDNVFLFYLFTGLVGDFFNNRIFFDRDPNDLPPCPLILFDLDVGKKACGP